MTSLLPQIISETDENGIITFYNDNAMDLTGYSKKEFDKGINIYQMLIPEDRKRAKINIQKRIEGKIPDSHEYTILRKDGVHSQ